METADGFIRKNMMQIIIGIFVLGGLYARFVIMETDQKAMKQHLEDEMRAQKDNFNLQIQTLEKRLDKKIKKLNELDNRMDSFEKCN